MNESPQAVLDTVLESLSSDGSRRVYGGAWRRFIAWLEVEDGVGFLEAKPKSVAAYVAYLRAAGKAKSTISLTLSVIREIYAAFVRDEFMASNPAREIKKPKMSGDPSAPYLNEDQARKLMSTPYSTDWETRRARACICLLLGLGWRRAEIARLFVEDFHDGVVKGTIKGAKSLEAGVPGWVLTEVEEWLSFSGITSGPMLPRTRDDSRACSPDMVYNMVKAYGRAVGVTVNPHALRRTNITILGDRGVSLKRRQLAIGHVSQSTTEKYDRSRDASKDAPGELLADLLKPLEPATSGKGERNDTDQG